MNFQEKILEATAHWQSRARAIAQVATEEAGDRARRRISVAKKSLTVLKDAGRELNQVARRHAHRFAKQNSPLIAAVRKDVSRLARATFSALKDGKPAKVRTTAARLRGTTARRRSTRTT